MRRAATPSLYLATRRADAPCSRREYASPAGSAGIEVALLDRARYAARFSFSPPAALLSPVAGELDAFNLTHIFLADGA